MKKSVSITALALGAMLVAGTLQAADVKSGLSVGEKPGAFQVKDITGPNQGKSLCYRCSYGGRPVVSVFTRDVNADVSQLVKQIDETVAKNGDKQMKAFVVLLSDDADEAAPRLTKLAKEKKIANTPLTVYDSVSGPPAYKIAKDADVTVLMWVDGKVKANHVVPKGGKLDARSIKSIVSDTSKILD